MKVANSIQISEEEDRQINQLKDALGFSTKKQVIREGLRVLGQIVKDQHRTERLRKASRLIRKQSTEINREWAVQSTAIKVK